MEMNSRDRKQSSFMQFGSNHATDLKYAIGLSPKEAIKYLTSKGYTFSWDWHEVWQEAHTKVFTVAKVMRKDILDDIREIVEKAITDGITLQQFKKELEPNGFVLEREFDELPWQHLMFFGVQNKE